MAVTISNSPVHSEAMISQPYGPSSISYSCGFHTGVDIVPHGSTSNNPPLYPVESGQVVYTNTTNPNVALGIQVQILGASGRYWRYCHMIQGSVNVTVGQQVTTGTMLGYMGATGNVQGRHLHLECSTSQAWNCNTFLNPCSQLGIPNQDNLIIYYDGSIPPEPPTPPEPSEPTPVGPFYHRLFNGKWFWSTAPNYTGSLTDESKKKENARYIWNYLKDVGWSMQSASVVIGAMDLVSTLNSAWKPTTDTESPFGLLGWRFWEFQDWVDAHGEWVADSDYTIIDNSIGRICWFRQYNLGWADEDTFTLQAFSESKDTIENLTTAWITNYLYNTLTYNDLLQKAKYWYAYLTKNNNWKYAMMNKTQFNLLT